MEYCSRPRILFASTFVWLSVTGGRFLAPFLEHTTNSTSTSTTSGEHSLTASDIGFIISLQQVVLAASSAVVGKWADTCEARVPGRGRLLVIGTGVLLASTAMSLHAISMSSSSLSLSLSPVAWHGTVQCLQGVGVSMVFPVLDGLTVDFLGAENRSAYGRERLHGPLWWAFSNLGLSFWLDTYGFGICYPLSWISAVFVIVTICTYYRHQVAAPQYHHHQPTLVDIGSDRDDTLTEHASASSDNEAEGIHLRDATARASAGQELTFYQLLQILTSTAASMGFLFCIFCLSSGQAVVDNLIFLFFEALGSHWLVMGITVFIKIAAEVPVFYFGVRVLLDTRRDLSTFAVWQGVAHSLAGTASWHYVRSRSAEYGAVGGGTHASGV